MFRRTAKFPALVTDKTPPIIGRLGGVLKNPIQNLLGGFFIEWFVVIATLGGLNTTRAPFFAGAGGD
jgi:hypothetical protein